MKPGDTVLLKRDILLVDGSRLFAGEAFMVVRWFGTSGGDRIQLAGRVCVPQVKPSDVETVSE